MRASRSLPSAVATRPWPLPQSKYKPNFREKGWTDPTHLREMRLEHIDDLGIRVPGHKKKLQNAMAALDFAGEPRQQQAQVSPVKFNSTSSLYIDSTISKPCIDEIIFCVSIAIHDRIQEGEERRAVAQAGGEDFPIMFDATTNRPLFNQPQPLDGPTEQSIFQIIKSIYTIAEFSSECLVISLLYIERLCSTTKQPILICNWQPILLSAMVVAQKVWDDRCLSNADFSVIAASYSLKDVNELEKQFLQKLQYNVSITASLYASYYFELRTLCEKKDASFTMRPLANNEAKVIEARTAGFETNMRENAHRKWQSMSGYRRLPHSRARQT